MEVFLGIRNIGPGHSSLSLRGIIIRTLNPREIRLRKDGQVRGVWTFTLRDSATDSINISFWGSFESANRLSSGFKIGDVVEVINGKVSFRTYSDSDEKYTPAVNSSFTVQLNETYSDVRKKDDLLEKYRPLLRVPTKPPGDFLTIADIHNNGVKLRDGFVNLLAAVRNIEPIREATSRLGHPFTCRNVFLIDHTEAVVRLTVWDKDLLSLSDGWQDRSTVLFLADIRVDRNDYYNEVTVKTSQRTVINENPHMSEAKTLIKFLQTFTFPTSTTTTKVDSITHKYADFSKIQKVMSCDSLLAELRRKSIDEEIPALVYCMLDNISSYMDGDRLVDVNCAYCKGKVDPYLEICQDPNCKSALVSQMPELHCEYKFSITLVDHSNALKNCRLTNQAACKLMGYDANTFQSFMDIEKERIRESVVLQYFTVRLVGLPPRRQGDKFIPTIYVMDIEPLSLLQYSKCIPLM